MAIPTNSILLDAQAVLNHVGIRAGMTVADLGCGTIGHFVIPAAKLIGTSGKVYAVDILKSVLDGVASRAKLEGVPTIEMVWGNCEMIRGVKIPDNTCDITLVVNNMYLALDRVTFLREAGRITKPGGKIVVVDWKTVASPLGPDIRTRVSSETVKLDAANAGLKLQGAWEPAPYFWGLVFMK